jgi:hypothetical protein
MCIHLVPSRRPQTRRGPTSPSNRIAVRYLLTGSLDLEIKELLSIRRRWSVIRSLVDKRSAGNAGRECCLIRFSVNMEPTFPRIREGLGHRPIYSMSQQIETRIWIPRHCDHLSQLWAACKIKSGSTDTTRVLESSNNVIFVSALDLGSGIFDNDRKVWPNIQILPDRSSVCTENL